MRGVPDSIRTLLDSSAFALAARIALTCAFWWGGATKLLDFQGAVGEAQHFGLAPATGIAMLTIVVELGASALFVVGQWTWLAAGVLGVFTMLATLIAHSFWTFNESAERFREFNIFLEHIGLVGGLALAAVLAARSDEGKK